MRTDIHHNYTLDLGAELHFREWSGFVKFTNFVVIFTSFMQCVETSVKLVKPIKTIKPSFHFVLVLQVRAFDARIGGA